MNSISCDILIIGSGPAGLCAAAELLRLGSLRVVVMEKGGSLEQRHCPVLTSGICPTCRRCDLLCGVGGASGIVGGKLCFFPAGERLATHAGYSATAANEEVTRYLDRIGFEAVVGQHDKLTGGSYYRFSDHASLKVYDAIPLLTHDMRKLFVSQLDNIVSTGGSILTNSEVIDVTEGVGADRFKAVFVERGVTKEIAVRHAVILATGRSTARWASSILDQFNVPKHRSTVDIGVRVEVPQQSVVELWTKLEDPKIKIHEGSNGETRTLCWCRGGELSITSIEGHCLIDGHFGDRKKPYTSVSLVHRIPVPDGAQPLDYALQHFHRPPGVVGPFHQTLHEFLGRPGSTPNTAQMPPIPFRCTPLDIRAALDRRVRDGIVELIARLNNAGDGRLIEAGGRVYGPVVDNCWEKPELDKKLMTKTSGLYVAGDITGLGRGIIQGLFSGLIISRAIHNQISEATYEFAQSR